MCVHVCLCIGHESSAMCDFCTHFRNLLNFQPGMFLTNLEIRACHSSAPNSTVDLSGGGQWSMVCSSWVGHLPLPCSLDRTRTTVRVVRCTLRFFGILHRPSIPMQGFRVFNVRKALVISTCTMHAYRRVPAADKDWCSGKRYL